MIKYQKTQYGYFLTILFSIIIGIIIYSSIYKIGIKPVPLVVTILISVLFLAIIVSFYKLKITINKDKITAKFGIGLLTKSFLINEIGALEKVKMPWYYGIGIRLTPKGWLWNIKFGTAIYIQNKNNTKSFLIGTNDADEIIKMLKNKVSSNKK